MTDQEAFDEWMREEVYPQMARQMALNKHERRLARAGFDAALAWLRSQGEPVAHGVGPGDWTYTISSPVRVGTKLFIAPQPAWRKVDDEIESGVGIRWVSDTGIHGRPTAHDVREYLERRGESAKCGCDKCTAPQPAIPDGWQLVPKALTDDMRSAVGDAETHNEAWERLLAAAPKP